MRRGIKIAKDVTLDVMKLIDSRMLVQANSGGGKSWLLRLIAEQTAPIVQTIILDPEGEFATLREKADMLLVGHGGELPADCKTASVLARRLCELRISCIVDLYELKLSERRRYVRLFLDSLMSCPRTLWHPMVIILDEAHMFCPERAAGEAESTDAVTSLLSRGRKRGFGAILATQRLSRLSKDAAAECNNVFIGRTGLDIDQKRAGELLGLSKDKRLSLRDLKPGEWFGYGPAVSGNGIVRFKAAQVTTTHPKAGNRHTVATPAASKAIQRVLPELEAARMDEEVYDLDEAKAQIAKLKRDLKSNRREANPNEISRAVVEATRDFVASSRQTAAKVVDRERVFRRAIDSYQKRLSGIAKLAEANGVVLPDSTPPTAPRASISTTQPPAEVPARQASHTHPASPIKGGLQQRMLIALAQYPDGMTKARLAAISGSSPGSGTFTTYLGRLKRDGEITASGGGFTITAVGAERLGDFNPLPVGEELRDYWRAELGDGLMRHMFGALLDAYPTILSKADLAQAVSTTPASGTFTTYLGRLRRLGLIARSGSGFVAASELFE